MKVSEMKYERIDIAKECEAFRMLAEKMRRAGSGKEMAEIREEGIRRAKHVQTMMSLSYIRFTLDTQNEFYLKEKDYYDESTPALAAVGADVNRAFLTNPHMPEALSFVNPNVAKMYELSLKVSDEKIVPDLAQENKLITEYDRLMSETTFRFRGHNLPLSVLRKYFDDADRKTRRESMTALGKTLEKIAPDLDRIFDKLVKVRTKMAKTMGFGSYAVMGDCAMGRYSYGREDIKKFRKSIKNDVVPLVSRRKKEVAARLGIDDFKLYDNEVCLARGNPAPAGNAEEMFRAAKEMYHGMGEETGRFIDEMLAADAFDVFARKGKWGGGYCTSIDDYGQPFILANFNGSSGDVDVLTHEAGHAFAYYEMFKRNLDYELNLGTMSVAEIHSMAMEFLAWRDTDKFFGDRADDYRYMHLLSSLTFLPYGTQVDEFQELCYDCPDMTPSERNDAWNKLDNYYRPYLSVKGIPYLEKGTRWQYQMHIYENPMYYIDYCLSQTVAHQILLESQTDFDKAFARYLALVEKGGELPFGELVESVGLENPLKENALRKTSEGIDRLLDRLSDRCGVTR